MSERILKLIAEETNLTTPGYVGANLLRLRNAGSLNYSIMVKDGSTITGSITLYPNEVIYIRPNFESVLCHFVRINSQIHFDSLCLIQRRNSKLSPL